MTVEMLLANGFKIKKCETIGILRNILMSHYTPGIPSIELYPLLMCGIDDVI
jgi:hypothetical protein